MANKQDPLLTKLEKKIMLSYTYPFLKAFSSQIVNGFIIYKHAMHS